MKHTSSLPPRREAVPKTYPTCSLKQATDLIDAQCGKISVKERHGKGPNKVIILPEAERELTVTVSYGRRSPMNIKEQKFLGFGHLLRLDEEGHTLTIVKHFIEIPTKNRTACSAGNLGVNGEPNPGLDILEYKREEFLKGEADFNTDAFGHQVDPFLSLCGPSEFVLEGHTHPDLNVFFSSTDKVTGAARAATTPICSFVCDPIRKKMLGSVGKDFADAEVIVYAYDTATKQMPTPKEPCQEADKVDEPLAPPMDEIVRLLGQCIHTLGHSGTVRLRTGWGGKTHLKVKLTIPNRK